MLKLGDCHRNYLQGYVQILRHSSVIALLCSDIQTCEETRKGKL